MYSVSQIKLQNMDKMKFTTYLYGALTEKHLSDAPTMSVPKSTVFIDGFYIINVNTSAALPC